MEELGGWVGVGLPSETAVQALTRLGGERTGDSAPHQLVDDCALTGHNCHCRSHDGTWVAVQGSPRWLHTEIQAIADGAGMTAAIAEAFKRWDADMLQHLQGSYALVLLSPQAGVAFAAVDRMGICSLAYACTPNGLVFGTNADWVGLHPAVAAGIDPRALFAYVYFHMVPSPLTIYQGVHKLEPGHCLRFSDNALHTEPYWHAEAREDTHKALGEWQSELHETLHGSVRRCLGNGSSGAFLSGGVDSSTVAGILSELRQPAHTFSIGFEASGYDEIEYARTAARHFGTTQHEYYVTPGDVVEAIPRIATSYDEPFGNSSAVPVYYCAQLARSEGVAHLLAGDGGDEVFGGNARYVKQQVFETYFKVPALVRKACLEPLFLRAPGIGQLPVASKVRSYINQANVPLPDRLETYNFLHRFPLTEIFEQAFLETVDTDQPIDSIRAVYARSEGASTLNRMLQLDWKFTLADNDLRKVNRMCQLAGVRASYPFLDDQLVAMSLAIPSGLKIRRLKLRHFFKQAMRDYLPRAVLTKSKHGFGLPFGVWMKDFKPLRELACDSLDSLARRNYVDKRFLQRLIDLHHSEHAHYYGELIWVLMMLEIWLQSDRDALASPGIA